MPTSELIAKIISPLFIIVAISMLLNRRYYHAIINELLETPPLLHFAAFIKLFIGILLVLFHNFWSTNWSILITLLGWIVLIKSLIFFLFPRQVIEFCKKMLSNPKIITFTGISCLIIGLFLSLAGFAELRTFLNL